MVVWGMYRMFYKDIVFFSRLFKLFSLFSKRLDEQIEVICTLVTVHCTVYCTTGKENNEKKVLFQEQPVSWIGGEGGGWMRGVVELLLLLLLILLSLSISLVTNGSISQELLY